MIITFVLCLNNLCQTHISKYILLLSTPTATKRHSLLQGQADLIAPLQLTSYGPYTSLTSLRLSFLSCKLNINR